MSESRVPNPPDYSVRVVLQLPVPIPKCAEQQEGNKANPGPWEQPQPEDMPSSVSKALSDENYGTIITRIRATDVALGLKRVPSGFYTTVQHSGREWRTENKPASVDDDVVQWDVSIPIPSDPFTTVCLKICATFESQSTLGDGEQLRESTVTVAQLLDYSTKDLPFTFVPEDDVVVSTCSSLFATVARQTRKCRGKSVSRIPEIHYSITEYRSQQEDVHNQGHAVAQENDPSSVEENSKSDLEARNPWALSILSLRRFQLSGDIADIQRAISSLKVVLQSTSVSDRRHLVGLETLGIALRYRFERLGELNDLDQAISWHMHAVHLTPEGHSRIPTRLKNLARALLTRFEHLGELSDLEHAISRLKNAAELVPQSHPDKPEYLNELANSFSARFERLGELDDLEQAILMATDVVNLTPEGHVDKPKYVNNLAGSARTRFERLGDLGDLETAISSYRDAVRLTPRRHPMKPSCLNNLADALFVRFEQLGGLADLEQAISMSTEAVDLTPEDHVNKPKRLSNLARFLFTRFERLRDLNDLESALSRYRDTVALAPEGHTELATYLNNLATCFRARFGHLGKLSDLEEGISLLKKAVDLTPEGQPGRHDRLNSIAHSLKDRFDHLKDLGSLEEAISRIRETIDLTPDDHPEKPSRLKNAARSLRIRFALLGKLNDLEEAISRSKEAVILTPEDHRERPSCLDNLASSILTRFEHLGDPGDLEQANATYRDAVNLTPEGHPAKPDHLNNLTISFHILFERFGELGDLQQAISLSQNVVDVTPEGHSEKPSRLNNLANLYLTRFDRLGELSDLEQAISRHRNAVDLTPKGHSNERSQINNLANSFFTRFRRLGQLSDLEEAISRYEAAVDLAPEGYLDKPGLLANLSCAFRARFELLGEQRDLERAISRASDAVDLTPEGHPDKPTHIISLAHCLRELFQRSRDLDDLNEVISKFREAVELSPDGHPKKPGRLNSLANSILTRFEHLEEQTDLEQATLMLREVVGLIPEGHPDRPNCLNNLAHSFFIQFKHFGELSDLEEAISTYRDVIHLIPKGHPDIPSYQNSLANFFISRFDRLRESSDLEQAMSLSSRAACASTGPIAVRFRASQTWISCARLLRHHSLLRAYSVSIDLLPQLAWMGVSIPNRYRTLLRGTNVVRDAAAVALDSGQLETAVKWLEQGRSIVWGELFQLRNSYEELSVAYPAHACRLRELSVALEHAGTAREQSFSLHLEQNGSAASLDQAVKKHSMLAIERDNLLGEIRLFPGFERFLLHKEFAQLRASARFGPVVILNAAESRCDALIIRADVDDVIHIPLPEFTLGRTKGLQNMVKELLGPNRLKRCDDREGKSVPQAQINWKSLLSVLWNCVVKPVLQALGLSTPGGLSRIFWCPTGPFMFLPIHAAGLYGTQYSKPGHKVFDFVVSSYIPTLSILASSPESNMESSENLRLLAVGQPPSDGQSPLPGVHAELEHIRTIIRNSSSRSVQATLLESSAGTVEEVLALMKEADWVHFSCHGIQDTQNPTQSGLCLADGRRLRLSDIMALSRHRSHGGLAFLSACQTATGDESLSDEAVHTAAGMLFAGYGGVVGTMWAISDRLAPGVAKQVYERLLGSGTSPPDYRQAARALHDAVGYLRENAEGFGAWIPFIHVGL